MVDWKRILLAAVWVTMAVEHGHGLTFQVTNLSDGVNPECLGGACTLRDAILAANATPGMDTIQLNDATYTLDLMGAGEDLAQTGDLDLDDPDGLVIEGTGSDLSAIVASESFGDRIFEIRSGPLTLRKLRLEGGNAHPGDGGAILVDSDDSLNLENCELVANRAAHRGGAIATQSDLILTDCRFAGNEANPLDVAGSGQGGAVFMGEDDFGMTATRCVFENNRSYGDPGMGGGKGGAIYLQGSLVDLFATPATVSSCVFENNQAESSGGGLFLGSEESASYVSLVLLKSTLRNNSAGENGGGIAHGRLEGSPTGANSLLFLEQNLFDGNEAGEDGGGIDFGYDSPTQIRVFLRNSTFAANRASGNGGGISIEQSPGTAFDFQINQCTLQANVADDDQALGGTGGGLYADLNAPAQPPTRIANTLVAKNRIGASIGPSADIHAVTSGDLSSGGHNLIGNAEGAQWVSGSGDLLGTSVSPIDPGSEDVLKDLGDGPEVYMLIPPSPAIGGGTNVANGVYPNGLTEDQRGRSRPYPVGGKYDIGAYEYDPADVPTPTQTPSNTPTASPTATPTATFTATFTSTATGSATPSASSTPSETPTLSPSSTATENPSLTLTPTGSPTQTATTTETPIDSSTPTDTPTPIDTVSCDLVPGPSPAPNPRCDGYDLLELLRDRGGFVQRNTDFNGDLMEDALDLFKFASYWHRQEG